MTGVQTCALPIWPCGAPTGCGGRPPRRVSRRVRPALLGCRCPSPRQACSAGTPALRPARPPGPVRLSAERSRTCPGCLTSSAVCPQGQESLQKPGSGSPPPATGRRRPRLRAVGEGTLRARGLRLISGDRWFCAL